MNPVYVMIFGAALSLGLNGAFDASYRAFEQGGASAAASALLSSTRNALREQDQSSIIQQREIYRAQGWRS